MRIQLRRRDVLKGAFAAGIGTLATPWGYGAGSVPESQWASFRNGLTNRGVANSTFPEAPELLWELTSPDGITSTPVIGDGKAYVGTLSGDVLCLDLQSGKEIWKYTTSEGVPANQLPPGFNSPLTLGTELVFAGDDTGTMHALDRATGKLKWKFDAKAEIVGGGLLFERQAGKGPEFVFGSHAEKLFAVDIQNGEEIWSFETHGPVNGTPTVSGNVTFVTGCNEPLMYVADLNSGTQSDQVPLNARLIASAADVEGVLYFGTDEGAVYALNWKEKKVIWEYSVPDRDYQINSSPAVNDEFVLIGSQDKHLHCINRQTGQQVWEFRTRGKIDSSPVIVGDRVVFGSADKNLYMLRIADGKEVWRYNAGQGVTGSPAIAEGKMVIGTDSSNGRILCFGKR